MMNNVYAVDLFCGAGALTKGLEQAGIVVKLGVDIDESCQYPYTANNNSLFLMKKVEDLEADELEAAFPKKAIRLLAGCAPCQTFSKYNQKAKPNDSRWWLLQHFSRLISVIKPEFVTMENVPGIVNKKIFKYFVNNLKEAQYNISYQVVNCAEYGVPQRRYRLVLLASLIGKIQLLTPSQIREQTCTVRDAIGHMPPIKAGEICKQDPMHQSSSLSPLNMQRIRMSKPGGTWSDWTENLVSNCHNKSTGKSYRNVYGRMNWDEPAPTITTQFYGFGNGRFGHPEQHRAISLREGAILQSFPYDYVFAPKNHPIMKQTIGRLVGNAVPVKLGWVIGKTIICHVQNMEIESHIEI